MSKGYVERPLTEAESDRIRLRARKEVKYFNKVYLSVTAASKMLNHAHFGQPREVMGLLQGTPLITQDPTARKTTTASSL
jgi:hypothetical protein